MGTSAGLCLYPDRYGYDYDGRPVGPPSPVQLRCTTSGPVPVPTALPEVVARIGIDLNPLDVTDPDDLAWLRALVWPGPVEAERLQRLDAAAAIAAQEPPRLLTGDLLDQLPDALALLPDGATPVVLHTAVLPYVGAAAVRRSSTGCAACRCAGSRRRGPAWCPAPGSRTSADGGRTSCCPSMAGRLRTLRAPRRPGRLARLTPGRQPAARRPLARPAHYKRLVPVTHPPPGAQVSSAVERLVDPDLEAWRASRPERHTTGSDRKSVAQPDRHRQQIPVR